MFKEGLLDKNLRNIKTLIPKPVFNFFHPVYHKLLAYGGALRYGFPSRGMKLIGVTGTKGKSTTVYMITKILEETGHDVAAIGSLGFKIKDKEWPNTLKMTMPGRFRLQKFLAAAKKTGCEFVVLEVTSEGIKEYRHLGIQFDAAIFTNLHREHLEHHGSFENYYHAKQELFRRTKNIHVLNADDQHVRFFGDLPAEHKIFFGIDHGDIRASGLKLSDEGATFEIYGTKFSINLAGRFNVLNSLAALATAAMYGVDLPTAKPILESIKSIPGRMEFIQQEPFKVVVDYAHTPDSLEAVYRTLKTSHGKLICVLGAAGGGRDRWKRPEFGRIAGEHCDEIILTDEDPYDEIPEKIIEEIEAGMKPGRKAIKILDRREAIKTALTSAKEGDTVVITGKGSEISMAVAGGKKIPWSDREVVREVLRQGGR